MSDSAPHRLLHPRASRGTESSNPSLSSRESATNMAFAATAHQNLPRPDGRRLRRLADLHHAIYATCISWPTEAPRPGRAKASRLKVALDRAIRGPEACRQSPLALTLAAASAHERRDAPRRLDQRRIHDHSWLDLSWNVCRCRFRPNSLILEGIVRPSLVASATWTRFIMLLPHVAARLL